MEQKERKEPSPKKKLKPECIRVDLFGDLLKFTKKAPDIQAPFRKYDALAIALAAETREERLLIYHFFCGIALTAHARRIKEPARRREVFELKNKMFMNIANNFTHRKFLNFRLCVSKRFKVVAYCPECQGKNKESGLEARDWKFCSKCTVDRNYFNVLSMFHKFKDGGTSLFLGNDLLPRIKGLKELRRVRFGALKEELSFRKFTFSPRNLVAIDIDSLLAVTRKLVVLDEQAAQTMATSHHPVRHPHSPPHAAHAVALGAGLIRPPGVGSRLIPPAVGPAASRTSAQVAPVAPADPNTAASSTAASASAAASAAASASAAAGGIIVGSANGTDPQLKNRVAGPEEFQPMSAEPRKLIRPRTP